MEREEDRREYLQVIERSSVIERRENGLTWYPVAIRGTEPGRADYLTVELERTTHRELPHLFRFGSLVAIFSNHDAKTDRIEGVISFQGGDRMVITLRTEALPEWSGDGKLGVDLLFDEVSYHEMQLALSEAARLTDKGDVTSLMKVLTGDAQPTFSDQMDAINGSGLNESQIEAVSKIRSANEIAIVHGPPGTGKTTTLVQAIKTMVWADNQKVLVTAPSNTAVDLLSDKLSAEGLSVLRVGNPVRVSEHLMALTLDARIAAHSSAKKIKKMRKRANEFLNMAHKYKRNFGRAEREQRKALFAEAHRILRDIEKTEEYAMQDVISQTQVVTATLVGANHYSVKHLRYDTIVIDEAGQSIEPACWIPILKGSRLVLAGDPYQLPPTIKSEEAAGAGLETTLLEKAMKQCPAAVVMLKEQYRMHEAIMGYPSRIFYDQQLKAHPSVARHTVFDSDEPFLLIDTAGRGFYEEAHGNNLSNPEEAAFLFERLTEYLQMSDHPALPTFPSIGIISPYRRQVELLREQMDDTPELQSFKPYITIHTIDSFQGQERDIIFISMTRSNPECRIGFLADIRRMNVAITRARKKLVIIGDGATLSSLPFYKDLIAYAEEVGGWRSAWEY